MTITKFRGKILNGPRKGEWVYGYYVQREQDGRGTIGHFIAHPGGCYDEVDPKTVGQYIGYTDKNGKEAYIGDISKNFFEEHIGIIEWHKTAAWIVLRYMDSRNGTYNFDHLSLEAFEIIGTIHDNPDLLTQ